MSAPAAIRGTFSDLKVIRGRKVIQIIVEVPIEQADAALAALGGVPMAAEERWVAVARLDLSKAAQQSPQAPEKDRRAFGSLPYAQQAALKCSDREFQRFLRVQNEDAAAIRVREICGVASRAEIEASESAKAKFLGMMTSFGQWSGNR